MHFVSSMIAASLTLCIAFCASAFAMQQATGEAAHGATVFKRCAACHLPDGRGVPGSYPPIAGRLETAAMTDAGRAYLVMVVSAGLMGEIKAGDHIYRGFMPAQAGLSDKDVAAVLNYAMALGAEPDGKKQFDAEKQNESPRPFTAEEVAGIRSNFENPNPNAVHAMREGVFKALLVRDSEHTLEEENEK